MKNVAFTLNALLLGLLLFMCVTEGWPSGPDAPLVLLVIFTSAASTFALRPRSNSAREEQKRVPPSPRAHRLDERKPLYEWIDTVERRLAAMEAARANHPERDEA